jgi:hypothetical protein
VSRNGVSTESGVFPSVCCYHSPAVTNQSLFQRYGWTGKHTAICQGGAVIQLAYSTQKDPREVLPTPSLCLPRILMTDSTAVHTAVRVECDTSIGRTYGGKVCHSLSACRETGFFRRFVVGWLAVCIPIASPHPFPPVAARVSGRFAVVYVLSSSAAPGYPRDTAC